jgi:hypothetical protein
VPGSASAARRVPFMKGVTFSEWGPTAFDPAKTRASLKKLKRQHVDTVTLFVVWMQKDRYATDIGPGSETARESRVKAAARMARSLGFKVILRPFVDLSDADWRGNLTPTSVPAWRASYTRFALHFARLAQSVRATGLVVGSETNSQQAPEFWRPLVGQIRSVFKGFVTYEANWDAFDTIDYWDAFDAIDISSYFPTSTQRGASLDDLVAGWSNYVGPSAARGRSGADWLALVDQVSRRFHLPVFFGEIGYRTVADASIRPWDLASSPADPAAQTTAYEAAFRVWWRQPFFRGFNWWIVNPDPHILDGYLGADYRPTPASLGVVKRYYAQRR